MPRALQNGNNIDLTNILGSRHQQINYTRELSVFYIRVSCVYESLTFQIGKMCVCGDFEILKRSWTGNLFCCAVMLRCTRFWGIEQSKAPYENIINNACACQTLNSVAHYKCIRELLLPATDLCENAYASVDIGVAFASTPSF